MESLERARGLARGSDSCHPKNHRENISGKVAIRLTAGNVAQDQKVLKAASHPHRVRAANGDHYAKKARRA